MARIPGEVKCSSTCRKPETKSEAGSRKSSALKEVFGCARLYHGRAPDLPIGNIFGVTSFEFG